RAGRRLLGRREPGAGPARPPALRQRPGDAAEADPAERGEADPGVRHPHGVGRLGGLHALWRQPAEGGHGAGAEPRARPADRFPAHPRRGRGVHRVPAPPPPRRARQGHPGRDRLHRAGRGHAARGPHRRDVRRADPGDRPRGRGPRRARSDDGRLQRRCRPRGRRLRRPHHRLPARRWRRHHMSTPDVAESSTPGIGGGSAETPPPPAEAAETALSRTLQRIARGDLLVVVMSFVFAFLIGSVLLVIADQEVRASLGYFFARPSGALTACWQSVSHAYGAMFRAALFDVPGYTRTAESVREAGGTGTYVLLPALAAGLRPLTETLTVATPLIIASAGMAVSFRAGLFNIGGTGQLIAGAMAAGYVGFTVDLPIVVHLLICLLA